VDKTLAPVTKEKDLGVVITSNLTWDQQILAVVSKANNMLGLLCRTTDRGRTCPLIKDTRVRRSLYLSLVKCHLNYATEVWSPAHISLKRKVENVQRRATRWILQPAGVQGSASDIRSSTALLWQGVERLNILLQGLAWIHWHRHFQLCFLCQ
jgi:hypothetical protein